MNILLKLITVNFSFLDMEKNLKEEFNCEICEEKLIIDQYYLFMRDKTMCEFVRIGAHFQKY